MAGDIDLRHLIGTSGNRIEEDTSVTVSGGRGGIAAVDLLDAVGYAFERLPIGNVLLDDLKARLFVVHKSDFARLARAQCHGLLRIAHDVRLRDRFFPHHIDISGDGREGGGTVRAGHNRSGITSGNRLNKKYCASNGLAAHGVALDDLHIRQRVVLGSHGVLLVSIGRVHIDADGRGVCTVPRGRFDFGKGPEALGNVFYLDDAAVFSHIAADNLTVTVDVEFCTVQPAGRSGSYLFQSNVSITRRRAIRIRLRSVDNEFSGSVIVEKRLIPAVARKGKHSPLCAIVLNNGRNYALLGICFDLTLECRVLLRLLREHPVDEIQVHFVGIGVGVAACIAIPARFSLVALMVPHIGLDRHKELPDIRCLAVVDVGHEPLDIGKRRGIHLTKAAIGNAGFEHGVGIRIGSRSVGIRIKE